MKKRLLITLLVLVVLATFSLTSCGTKDYKCAYDDYNLADYVTLYDYESDSYEAPNPEVTDEEVEKRVREKVEATANEVEINTGIVKDGDKVEISYSGVLEDGTTDDGMNSDSFTLTIGTTSMIDGFTDSIIGKSVGDEYDVDLMFPDPYPNKEEFSGKGVTFTIKVLGIFQEEVPEFNDEWVAQNSEYKTVDEYNEYIKGVLFNEKAEEEKRKIQQEIYENLCDKSVVSEVIKERVEKEIEIYDKWLRSVAIQYGTTWEEFISTNLQVDSEEAYQAQLEEYGNSVVKADMVIYAACQKEGIHVEQAEIDELCDSLLSSSQATEEQFLQTYGVTVEECLHIMSYDYQLYAGKLLDAIYDNLMDK